MANFISASDMHSEPELMKRQTHYVLISLMQFLLLLCSVLFIALPSGNCADMEDRVVAYIDNEAITLSELEITFADTLQVLPTITKREVLDTMINRVLLLREAKKLRLESPSDDELLNEYIDLKIRAFIRIKENDLSEFYQQHIADFQGKDFDSAREEIETYLVEKELNERLKEHIEGLKQGTCIGIQLEEKS